MRNLVILLSLTFVAAAAYFYGPKVLGEQELQTEPETIGTSGEVVGASLKTLRLHAPEPPRVERAPVKEAAKPVKIRRKAKTVQVPNLPAAPKLAPAEKAKKSLAAKPQNLDPRKAPKSERNFSNPMRDRWIDDLSGADARFSMGKKTVDRSCRSDVQDCAELRKDNEVSLVGVVVKTETLVENPTQPLSGNVKTGTYLEYLPAVYVE